MAARQLISKHKTQAKAAFAAFVLVAVAVGIFAYPTQTGAQTFSDDATLSALTVSPKNIIGFAADQSTYDVGVDSTVTQATITATTTDSNATVVYSTTDADTTTPGHQVNLDAGLNAVRVTVTAEDTTTTKTYRLDIGRGVTTDYGWNAGSDLNGLVAAGNNTPQGIWGDSSTIWVVDAGADSVYAYNRDGTRDTTKEFDLHSDHDRPYGAWSNGTTVWIVDTGDDKLYAYEVSSGTRQSSKEISLHADNGRPRGVWSDGETVWVSDSTNDKLYAYLLDGGTRQESRDISVSAATSVTVGIWSDGVTMWVLTPDTDGNEIIQAYNLANGNYTSARDFNTLSTADIADSSDIWSDGETMWVADSFQNKVYSFNMRAPSDDADLSALTVSPKDIIGFLANRTSYEVGVASTVTEATIGDTFNDGGASVVITPSDSNDVTDGHQVALSAGKNPVTITVTAEDTTTIKAYTVNINQGVTDDYGWKAGDDLDGLIAAGNRTAAGIWSNGTTTWIADSGDDKIYAYNPDGTRDSAKDFDTLAAAENTNAAGIWSDGTTMWVGDFFDNKLYAYRMSDQERDDTKDFDSLGAAGNTAPTSIWSDGTTMWVSDFSNFKLYAYRMSDQERDDTKDFDSLSAAGNSTPNGIWSDGTTMWVADWFADKLFAYRMSDQEPNSNRDFDTLSTAGNDAPTGMWSDGATMWVTDEEDDKAYAYNMPPPTSNDATLTAITLAQGTGTPAEIAGFDRFTTGYTVTVDLTTTQVTVAGTKRDPQATGPVISPADADSASGHQVNVGVGNTAITFVVTAEDGSTGTYTVTVTRTAVPAAPENFAAGAGDTEIHLSWDNPNDASITHYQYRYRVTTSSTWVRNWTNIPGSDAGTTSYTITRLSNGTGYIAEVRAVNSVDNGPESTGTATPRVVPTAPGAPRNLRVAASDQALTLNWNAPSSNGNAQITSYTVQYKLETATDWETADQGSDPAALTHRISGLNNNDAYQVRVAAVNSEGPGPWTNGGGTPNPFYRPPDPPRDVAVAAGDGSITVTWNTPAHDGNGRITGYLVEYRRQGQTAWQQVADRPASSTSRRQVVSGLENFNSYDVRVSAGNQYGAGGWARGSGGTWNTPTQATNLVASSEDGALRISWEPPERDGGLPTNYEVYYQPAGSPEDLVTIDRPGRASSRQELIPDLANGQEYRIFVFTSNRLGYGAGRSTHGEPGVCETGSSQDGYWRISWLDSETDRSITARDYGLHTLKYCAHDELPVDHYLYQRQLCKGSNCHNPQAFHADDFQYYGVDRNLCVPTENGCTRRGSLSAAVAAMDDLPVDSVGLVLNAVYMEWIAGQTNASYYQLQPEDFRQYVVPRFAERDDYLMFSTCEGGLCGSPRVVRGSDLARACAAATSRCDAQQGQQAQQTRQAQQSNQPATGQPTISGTPAVGETLTADTSDIEDVNGLTNAEFTYQWVRYDGSSDTDIAGATGATYTVTDDDVGQLIKVRITFTDDEDHEESATSNSVYVQAPQPLYGGFDADTVPGSHDGETAFTFQLHFSEEPSLGWEAVRDHVLQVTNGDVTGARRTTGGSNIRWDITLEPAGNDDVTVTLPATTDCAAQGAVCTQGGKMLSNQTGITVPGPVEAQQQQQEETPANTAATGQPTINGTARVGETLTVDTSGIADEDGLDDAAFSYQWIRNDGNADSDISGATSSTHTLVDAAEGKVIKVRVTFTDDGGNDETLTSAATAAVAAAPPTNNEATGAPAISGTVKVGHVLTADITGIADQDGLDNADFDYQWLADDSPIPGATASAYLLVAADRGRALAVRVSFTDDGDSDESLTSAATAAVTTSPLTVSLENEPDTPHDGQNTFTFQLRFSEEFYVSYLTLKDDAFTVDGGEVANARRMDRDSITPNIHWAITVRPNGDGDVTITLPETTDCNAAGAICTEDQRMLSNCDAEGAICTEDQRMLSNPLELTVSGPSS